MATWTAATKPTPATWTAQSKPTNSVLATPGQYYGFGAFTYSGGQMLVAGTGTHWTAQSKS